MRQKKIDTDSAIGIGRLISRAIRQKLTVEEEQALQSWLNEKEGNRLLYEKIMKEADDPSTAKQWLEANAATALHQVRKRLEAVSYKQSAGFIQRWLYRGMAAAAVVIILGGGIYLLWRGKEHTPVPGAGKTSIMSEVPPGGNRATLILANGSEIKLDSIANGLLARQGNTRIVKQGSGQIAYNNSTGKDQEVVYNTITTPKGGQYQIILSDGSKVWLNASSSLRFPAVFTGKERSVTLTGEGYFEVNKRTAQPFLVNTAGMTIVVLGTRFNVMAYADEPVITTTLLEGTVKVSQGTRKVLLRPGQQAITDRDMKGKISISAVDTANAVAWKNGNFSFYRTNIYEIMRQISRWYDVDISFQDSLNVILNGNISRNVNASEVFNMLELTGELKLAISGKKIMVSKRTGKYQQ